MSESIHVPVDGSKEMEKAIGRVATNRRCRGRQGGSLRQRNNRQEFPDIQARYKTAGLLTTDDRKKIERRLSQLEDQIAYIRAYGGAQSTEFYAEQESEELTSMLRRDDEIRALKN